VGGEKGVGAGVSTKGEVAIVNQYIRRRSRGGTLGQGYSKNEGLRGIGMSAANEQKDSLPEKKKKKTSCERCQGAQLQETGSLPQGKREAGGKRPKRAEIEGRVERIANDKIEKRI